MADILYLRRTELPTLLQAARRNKPSDYALLLTIYIMALRISEATVLKIGDYDSAGQRLMISVLKRFHRKKLPDGTYDPPTLPPPPRVRCDIPAELATVLDAQVEERKKQGAGRSAPLFTLKDSDKHMTRWEALGIYHKAAKAAGLDAARVRHPHLLRHSRAMHQIDNMRKRALKEGVEMTALEMMKQLKDLLRHASDTVCLQYIHATERSADVSKKATADLMADLMADVEKI